MLMNPMCVNWFTFQYGSTLIIHTTIKGLTIYKFTFQYGSTLMPNTIKCNINTTLFTFQYGSTLIYVPIFMCLWCIFIYIPIWFYFNLRK